MGVSQKTLGRIAWLFECGALPPRGCMLELGSQNLVGMEQRTAFVRKLIDDQRRAANLPEIQLSNTDITTLTKNGKMSHLMKLLGFEYLALDIFVDDEVHLFDLNIHELSTEMTARFDIVTNFGTTEHVFDQFRAFRTIHTATKVGGIMYHDLPMGGYLDHGYFCYTPLFFRHVALANEYQILFDYYSVDSTPLPTSSDMSAGGYPAAHYCNQGIEFAFKRTSDAPFRMPLEVGTSLGLDSGVWGGTVPYRVIHGSRGAEALERSHLVTCAPEPPRPATALVQLSQLQSHVKSFKACFSVFTPLKRLFRLR